MINFVIELVRWYRARSYRDQLLGKPYFWGSPDDPSAYERWQAFRKSHGR